MFQRKLRNSAIISFLNCISLSGVVDGRKANYWRNSDFILKILLFDFTVVGFSSGGNSVSSVYVGKCLFHLDI